MLVRIWALSPLDKPGHPSVLVEYRFPGQTRGWRYCYDGIELNGLVRVVHDPLRANKHIPNVWVEADSEDAIVHIEGEGWSPNDWKNTVD